MKTMRAPCCRWAPVCSRSPCWGMPRYDWYGSCVERGHLRNDCLQGWLADGWMLPACPQWRASCWECPRARTLYACRCASSSSATHVRALHRQGDSNHHPFQSAVPSGAECCLQRTDVGGGDRKAGLMNFGRAVANLLQDDLVGPGMRGFPGGWNSARAHRNV